MYVCVSQWKEEPDKWEARQATPAILRVSSSKHNPKKITTRVRGPFHQSITAILTEEKREEKQFTKPTHVCVFVVVPSGFCNAGTHNCHQHATCTPLPSGFNCKCKPGFQGDGRNCKSMFLLPFVRFQGETVIGWSRVKKTPVVWRLEPSPLSDAFWRRAVLAFEAPYHHRLSFCFFNLKVKCLKRIAPKPCTRQAASLLFFLFFKYSFQRCAWLLLVSGWVICSKYACLRCPATLL